MHLYSCNADRDCKVLHTRTMADGQSSTPPADDVFLTAGAPGGSPPSGGRRSPCQRGWNGKTDLDEKAEFQRIKKYRTEQEARQHRRRMQCGVEPMEAVDVEVEVVKDRGEGWFNGKRGSINPKSEQERLRTYHKEQQAREERRQQQWQQRSETIQAELALEREEFARIKEVRAPAPTVAPLAADADGARALAGARKEARVGDPGAPRSWGGGAARAGAGAGGPPRPAARPEGRPALQEGWEGAAAARPNSGGRAPEAAHSTPTAVRAA